MISYILTLLIGQGSAEVCGLVVLVCAILISVKLSYTNYTIELACLTTYCGVFPGKTHSLVSDKR